MTEQAGCGVLGARIRCWPMRHVSGGRRQSTALLLGWSAPAHLHDAVASGWSLLDVNRGRLQSRREDHGVEDAMTMPVQSSLRCSAIAQIRWRGVDIAATAYCSGPSYCRGLGL